MLQWPHQETTIGTAFFVGKRVLLTAAHNLYDREGGEWASSVRVFPGRDGNQTPYGSDFHSESHIPTDYIESSEDDKWNYDIGWIILPSRTLYNKVGYHFGYMHTTDANLKTMNLNSAGYPGVKDMEQWRDYETKSQKVFPMKFDHYHDNMGGSSGSPMYQIDKDQRMVAGVQASESETLPVNGATRITRTYFNWTKDFKRQYP